MSVERISPAARRVPRAVPKRSNAAVSDPRDRPLEWLAEVAAEGKESREAQG
jgi:hypothetical protein